MGNCNQHLLHVSAALRAKFPDQHPALINIGNKLLMTGTLSGKGSISRPRKTEFYHAEQYRVYR
jgi:hypothetical protein